MAAYGAGGGKWVMTPAVPLAAGRWQHVALVKTREDLRFYLNGVLVAAEQDTAPARPSPMPVAVGLGYTAQERCFRGLIDDFRIWNMALTAFDHAGIDPAAARETRVQCLDTTPRPAAGAAGAVVDARHRRHAADARRHRRRRTGRAANCPARRPAGTGSPTRSRSVSCPTSKSPASARRCAWRFVDAAVDESDGRKLTLRFACDDPALEVTSAVARPPGSRPGPSQPAHHQPLGQAGDDRRATHVRPGPDGRDRHVVLPQRRRARRTRWACIVVRSRRDQPGRRYSVRTAPTGEFIPYVGARGGRAAGGLRGAGVELLPDRGGDAVRRCVADRARAGRQRRGPPRGTGSRRDAAKSVPVFSAPTAATSTTRATACGAGCCGTACPTILRQDPGYPKVQWNAFGATGKTPGSWDPVEKKYYPLIDDIAPLGFEEVMIDVGWWQGNEPDSDQADWPSGMKKAADYAHQKGLRFGLYWTDNLDMANPAARRQRADRIRRLFREYGADMWRSDCTRGEVIGASYAATRGFYEMVDALAKEIPGFQWENCSGGGRIKDYGAMRRAVKIFNSDTYSPLHVRQAFYDSSLRLPPDPARRASGQHRRPLSSRGAWRA